MSTLDTFFSASRLTRSSELRNSPAALSAAFQAVESAFLLVQSGVCVVRDNRPALLPRVELGELEPRLENSILLGELDGRYIFAVNLEPALTLELPPGCELLEGRGLLAELEQDDAHLLAYARAMSHWQNNHRYCGVCGSGNAPVEGGFVMSCSNTECGQRSFPRLDPAVIVLVHDNDRCLLGRQPHWPEGRFSTIAGFAEPGESLEGTIRREVKEETNIDVGDCHYLGSQPWPFPAALMIGFHATALSRDIALNDQELAEAGWYTREQLRDEVILPPRQSIAFQLIAAWHDEGSSTALADIPRKEAFNAPRA